FLFCRNQFRRRHILLGGFKFAQQTLHIFHVDIAIFGVDGIFIPGGSPRKESAFTGVSAGIGAIGNAVLVDIEIASKAFAHGFELLLGKAIAPVVVFAVIPLQGFTHVVVHTQVEISKNNDRGLQYVGEFKTFRTHFKTFLGSGRKQQYVLGVAVGGVSSG